MNFIDEAKIYLKSGNGGDGAISFHREKFIDKGGPNGGDGGNGGNVIIKSTGHLNTLIQYKYKKYFKAQNGENGKKLNKSGKSGLSILLEVPIGTQILSHDMILLYDFTQDQESFIVLKGGIGGKGNQNFKSSINQTPKKRTKGTPGEEMFICLQLKLLCDIALVGLPNAGKSTFLASTTKAKPKIANYPFTTIIPNLGMIEINAKSFVIADIPGLIPGAHLGRGLGDKFLKHIERSKVLIHLIDITTEDILKAYSTIRNELSSYSKKLAEKTEIICLNKCDSLSEQDINDKIFILEKNIKSKIFTASAISKVGLQNILDEASKHCIN